MQEMDCALIVDGGLGSAGQRQLACILEAHRRAGIRTGLLWLRDSRTAWGWLEAKELLDLIDGEHLIWIDPSMASSAPLSLILSPKLARIEPTFPLKLRTEQAIIWPIETCGAPPVGDEFETPLSLADEAPVIASTIAERLNSPVFWAARTAGERHYLKQNAVGLPLADWVWWPLLDEAQTTQPQESGTTSAVGRHWQGDGPLDAKAYGELAAAFGDAWPMDLAFHGKRTVLESLPSFDQDQGMMLIEAEQQPLDAFFRHLSLFVAAGERAEDSLVPHAVFQAMQADVVVIAQTGLSAVIDAPFPEADLPDLMGLASVLLNDDIALERARRRQRSLIDERHSAKAHQTRIAPFLTSGVSVAGSAPSIAIQKKSAEDRILFVSDDSPHLEHLTRELAIAERLPPGFKPHFITTARNAGLVEQRGHPVDFVPAHNSAPYRDLFEDASYWNECFERHLAELIALTRARALVFDGVYPFGGIMTNRGRFPNLPFVWIRQPLWRASAARDALKHSREMDLVIEPGDLALAYDRGPLGASRHQVLPTAPIVLDDLLPRDAARRALGLGDEVPPAFLLDATLSPQALEGETATTLLDSLEEQGASLWCIDPGRASFMGLWPRAVRRLEEPDAGRYRAAFDGAISPADYRSLHDQVAAGLPSILLAGFGSSTDDQAARAAFAEGEGFALTLRYGDLYGARRAARQLMDPIQRQEMAAAVTRHRTENGAGMAALAIADLAYSVPVPKLA